MITQLCGMSSPACATLHIRRPAHSQFQSHLLRAESPTMSTDLAAAIRTAFDNGGFTQAKLAEAIGVHESTVSLWISGKRTPTVKNLEKLARAMGLETKALWSGPEAIPANEAQLSVLQDMNELDPTQQEIVAALVRSMKSSPGR